MLEYSDERRPWESMEEKLTLIRFVIHFSCIHFIFSLQQLGEFHSYSQEKDANDFLNFVRFGVNLNLSQMGYHGFLQRKFKAERDSMPALPVETFRLKNYVFKI